MPKIYYFWISKDNGWYSCAGRGTEAEDSGRWSVSTGTNIQPNYILAFAARLPRQKNAFLLSSS